MATVQQTFAFLQAGDAVAKDPVALARPKPIGQLDPPEARDGVAEPLEARDVAELQEPRDSVAELQGPRDSVAELQGPRDGVAELQGPRDGVAELRKTATAAPSQLNLDSREMIALRCCGSCVPKLVVSARQAISRRRPCRPVARRSTPCCPRVD